MYTNLTDDFLKLRNKFKEEKINIVKDLVKHIETNYKPQSSTLFHNCLECGDIIIIKTQCESCRNIFCKNHLYESKCHKCRVISNFSFETNKQNWNLLWYTELKISKKIYIFL